MDEYILWKKAKNFHTGYFYLLCSDSWRVNNTQFTFMGDTGICLLSVPLPHREGAAEIIAKLRPMFGDKKKSKCLFSPDLEQPLTLEFPTSIKSKNSLCMEATCAPKDI